MIKIFKHYDINRLQDEVNKFIIDKDIISISQITLIEKNYMVVITWKEMN